jgi:hypothetical protein
MMLYRSRASRNEMTAPQAQREVRHAEFRIATAESTGSNPRLTGKPEVMPPDWRMRPINAPAVSDQSLERSRLPGTNLLDEWIGDLSLIAEDVAIQLAKITCPTGLAIHRQQVPTAIRIPRPLMPGPPP